MRKIIEWCYVSADGIFEDPIRMENPADLPRTIRHCAQLARLLSAGVIQTQH